jgi:hypothetical protein
VCKDLQDQVREDRIFIFKVITGDASWAYEYDPVIPAEESVISATKKARQVRSKFMSMLIIFFDKKRTIQKELVPQGLNQQFCLRVLRRLREDVW